MRLGEDAPGPGAHGVVGPHLPQSNALPNRGMEASTEAARTVPRTFVHAAKVQVAHTVLSGLEVVIDIRDPACVEKARAKLADPHRFWRMVDVRGGVDSARWETVEAEAAAKLGGQGDAFMPALAALMREAKCLFGLHIEAINLGPLGAAALCAALREAKGLTKLHLWANSGAGYADIIEAARYSPSAIRFIEIRDAEAHWLLVVPGEHTPF